MKKYIFLPVYILAISIMVVLLYSVDGNSDMDNSSLQKLALSDTLTVSWPADWKATTGYLPSLGGFWIEGKLEGNPYSMWIMRKTPDILANKPSVSRMWEGSLAVSKSLGDSIQDKGCEMKSAGAFECVKFSKSSKGNFVAETIFWNQNTDIVNIRIMSKTSETDVQRILKQTQINRSVASNNKTGTKL